MRKEVEAVSKQAHKMPAGAGGSEAWANYVVSFYAKHAELVAETLAVSDTEARVYCARHKEAVLKDLRVLETWASIDEAVKIAQWALGAEVAA